MLRNAFFLLMLLFMTGVYSQSEMIKGTVIDYSSGEPLVGATILHIASGKEVITDFDGKFEIAIDEPGINKLKIKYISYQEAELNRIFVKESAAIEIKIKMRRKGEVEVEATAKNNISAAEQIT